MVAVAVYEDLLDLFVKSAEAERLLAFRPSDAKQEGLDALLEKNREGTLTVAETVELATYERFEPGVRFLKARVLQKLQV